MSWSGFTNVEAAMYVPPSASFSSLGGFGLGLDATSRTGMLRRYDEMRVFA
jgi:hypothetical protein